MRTSFHHQPEAQHPKSSAIHKLAGRLPHLLGVKRTWRLIVRMSAFDPKRTCHDPQLSLSGSAAASSYPRSPFPGHTLENATLRDIGITRCDAHREMNKPTKGGIVMTLSAYFAATHSANTDTQRAIVT
jgi:hypothetical protein